MVCVQDLPIPGRPFRFSKNIIGSYITAVIRDNQISLITDVISWLNSLLFSSCDREKSNLHNQEESFPYSKSVCRCGYNTINIYHEIMKFSHIRKIMLSPSWTANISSHGGFVSGCSCSALPSLSLDFTLVSKWPPGIIRPLFTPATRKKRERESPGQHQDAEGWTDPSCLPLRRTSPIRILWPGSRSMTPCRAPFARLPRHTQMQLGGHRSERQREGEGMLSVTYIFSFHPVSSYPYLKIVVELMECRNKASRYEQCIILKRDFQMYCLSVLLISKAFPEHLALEADEIHLLVSPPSKSWINVLKIRF